ncbi:MAG: glucose/galactose MFS transporter, partial [Flavobacteriaceae bacterium]|nr:glucose/galactose MFS transporter [Flavobacteriaceae bacterium]
TMGFGCLLFYPAASLRLFPVFLFAYFTLAAGMTILQVAANPYVAVLGSEGEASSRLNLSQAFNSLGTAIAPIAGAWFILRDHIKTKEQIAALTEETKTLYLNAEAAAVQKPFLGIAIFIVLIAVFFAFVRLPKLIEEKDAGTYLQALKHKRLSLGVLGIFFYVGAEVAIGSYLVNYFLEMNMAEAIKKHSFMTTIVETILNTGITNNDNKAIV